MIVIIVLSPAFVVKTNSAPIRVLDASSFPEAFSLRETIESILEQAQRKERYPIDPHGPGT